MKRSQIRYKGVAKKVFKKHFSFGSSREHSRWQRGRIHKNFWTFVRQNTSFLSVLGSQKSLRKPRKGGLTSGRLSSILKNEEIIRIQGLHQKKFKISVLRDANFARKNFSTTPQKQKKIGDNPPLGNRVVDLSNITQASSLWFPFGCETEAEGRNEGGAPTGGSSSKQELFLSFFTTMSKGATLSREEGYNFARMEG